MPEDSNETVKIVRNKKTDKRKVNSDGNQARDNNIDPNNSAPIKRQRTISKKGSQINTESEDMSDSEVVTFNPRNDSFGESASEKDIDERDASSQGEVEGTASGSGSSSSSDSESESEMRLSKREDDP